MVNTTIFLKKIFFEKFEKSVICVYYFIIVFFFLLSYSYI